MEGRDRVVHPRRLGHEPLLSFGFPQGRLAGGAFGKVLAQGPRLVLVKKTIEVVPKQV
jgi:hypothetical protein